MSFTRIAIDFWVAFLASALLAKPIMNWLHWTKSKQTISAHAPSSHQAKQGTPTMGGLIVLKGATVALIAASFWGAIPTVPLILVIGFGLIGFVDDFVVPRMMPGKRGLGWKQKFLMQAIVAAIAVGFLFGWHFGAAAGAYIFLIMFFSNAYNFSDGLDGLAGSLLLAIAVGLVFFAVEAKNQTALDLVLPLVGGIIPFLFLNAPPAKVFMGDVGSLPIGACIGCAVATLALPQEPIAGHSLLVPLSILSGMMIVELVPVPLQILSVKLRKKKLFPFTPIHHAFEKAGWPETRVVWAFALCQLLMSAAAITIYLWRVG